MYSDETQASLRLSRRSLTQKGEAPHTGRQPAPSTARTAARASAGPSAARAAAPAS
jgi:hypothetical protein